MLNSLSVIKNVASKYKKKIITDYEILETIGEGTYGKVKLATHILTNEKVAIKYIDKNRLIRVNDTERIQSEMKIISELNHPNIWKSFEIFEDEINFYIVMERPIKGDWFNYVCDKRRWTNQEATFIFYQIVNAITYLHSHNIVHRDMKPENIMWTEDWIVKVGDFGLSKKYVKDSNKLSTTCGSPCYSAPEMWRGNKYLPKPVDVWGIGIIWYTMICGQLPFNDNSEETLYRKIVQCDYNFPHFCSKPLKALLKRIFTANPADRISLEDIKQDAIYNMGRSNFIKECKIYQDDGTVRPNVHEFISSKSRKMWAHEYSEVQVNVEKTSAFKIFYYKLLHKTKWSEYQIPNENCDIEEPKVRDKSQDNNNNNKNNKNNSAVSQTAHAKSGKKNRMNKSIDNVGNNDWLGIPQHEGIGTCFAMLGKIPKTKIKTNKNTKTNNWNVVKLGIITHSFDGRWDRECNHDYKKEDARVGSLNKNKSMHSGFSNPSPGYEHDHNNNSGMYKNRSTSAPRYDVMKSPLTRVNIHHDTQSSKDQFQQPQFVSQKQFLPSGRRIPFKV